ncbi:hypothetical protein BG004_004972 [Podila humilis]|nr:hypothetical protein BG004_004972 [Podila humilis]
MKKEKELKEQRAKESQPFDIFSLAGVNLPTSGSTGGLNMTIRHDSQSAPASAIGSVKRPRKDRSVPSSEDISKETSSVPNADESTTAKSKLKRSSMAVRNDNQDVNMSREPTDSTDPAMQGADTERQLSAGSVEKNTHSPELCKSNSSSSATPPTPIPSPKNDGGQRRGSNGGSPNKPELARDMTHNVHSRAGSVDDDEEMVIDMFGRSVPRSRHHSSDEGSDSEAEEAHPRRRRRIRHEEDEVDRYRPSNHGRSGRYRSRSRSRSRSHSRSPSRRHRGRSRSRSVSPYYPHSRASDDRRRRRRGDRERDHSGDEMPPRTPAEEVDPYQAASRYLDTAFYPTKIYVGNLPSSISLTSLRTLFGPFGDIEDMNLVEGKDFGFVTYVEPAGAQQALAKMNGAMLDGTFIRVNRAKIPERNRRGFAGVAWMDEDGELARQEEEQHQQAAAIAGSFLASSGTDRQRDGSGNGHQDAKGSRRTGDDIAALERSLNSSRDVSPSLSTAGSLSLSQQATRGPVHQLPARPRSPKLPPKPTGAASFPPMGVDPRAALSGRGGGRQILRYDDL